MKLAVMILSMLLCLGMTADKNEISWYDWNEGYKKGLETNKIIMVKVYTDWCGPCKKMDKYTFSNKQIVKMVNKNFIPIKFNPELNRQYEVGKFKIGGRQLQAMLSKGKNFGYPTTFFLFPDEKIIHVEEGFQNASFFKLTLKKYMYWRDKGLLDQEEIINAENN